MKIAGRKNDGAWFRFNNFVKDADAATRSTLVGIIEGIDTLQAAHTALVELGEAVGLTDDNIPSTPEEWASIMGTKGVARQVWMGTLSFDTYREGPVVAGRKTYIKEHELAFRKFSVDLRYVVTRFMFGSRAVKDLVNKKTVEQGNPSGVADAVKGT